MCFHYLLPHFLFRSLMTDWSSRLTCYSHHNCFTVLTSELIRYDCIHSDTEDTEGSAWYKYIRGDKEDDVVIESTAIRWSKENWSTTQLLSKSEKLFFISESKSLLSLPQYLIWLLMLFWAVFIQLVMTEITYCSYRSADSSESVFAAQTFKVNSA